MPWSVAIVPNKKSEIEKLKMETQLALNPEVQIEIINLLLKIGPEGVGTVHGILEYLYDSVKIHAMKAMQALVEHDTKMVVRLANHKSARRRKIPVDLAS